VILVDTSALVRSLTGPRDALPRLEELVTAGERLRLSSLALYEWRRGPRTPEELAYQEELLPSGEALPFDSAAALRAADLFRTLGRPRRRQIDLAIAATAMTAGARLWTLDAEDFVDIPELFLVG
jgi:predicted nucleic acid-binding protein